MGIITQTTSPFINAAPVSAAGANQSLTNFFIIAVTKNGSSFTPLATGTPLKYGQMVVIQDITKTTGWQTGPCSISCNDVITFNPVDTTNDYQVWVLVDPVTGAGLYNGSSGYPGSIANAPVPYGATCYLQSVGKKDSNGNYQYAIANKGIISTSAVGKLPTKNYDQYTAVLLGGTGNILYADGSSVSPPTSYTPGSGGTYGGTQLGSSANPSAPIINPPLVNSADAVTTPLTTDQQLVYDDYGSGSTARRLLGYYLIFGVIAVILALIIRVIMEIVKSRKKAKEEEEKTQLTNTTAALSHLIPEGAG